MDLRIFIFTIVAFGLHLVYGATEKNKSVVDGSKIYFPEEPLATKFGEPEDLPKECSGKSYCDVKPPNYPQEKYNKLFNGTKTLSSPQLIIESKVETADRLGDDADDNCDVKVTFKPLYQVRSKRGDWHTVIQAPELNYVQQVRLETCRDINAPCFTGIGYGPYVTTGCVQKYSVWEFVVDDKNGGTEKIKSELPICCSCHYSINFEDRIGNKKK